MSNKTIGVAFFDSDGTITKRNSNRFFAERRGMSDLAERLEQQRADDVITSGQYNSGIAPVYKGLGRDEVVQACLEIPLVGDVKKTTDKLRENGIASVIVTCGLGDVARIIKERYGFDFFYGAELKFDNRGKATGYRTSLVGIEHKPHIVAEVCGRVGLHTACTFGIGDSFSDKALFEAVGTSIAFNYDESLDVHADHYVRNESLYDEVVPIIMGVVKNDWGL
jgi:HAD superfamily phosphoserine phosphatase-like hydrolase